MFKCVKSKTEGLLPLPETQPIRNNNTVTSLGRNIVANLIGRVWITLLGIFFVPLYLKFMGIEAYGLVGFFATLQGVLGLLDLGIGSTLNREIARLSITENSGHAQRDLVRTLESLYWGIAIIGGSLIFFLAPFIAQHWIKTQELSPTTVLSSVRLMGVAVALQFPFSLYQGGLMGLQRQVLVNIILVAAGTLRSVGAVLLLWLVSPTIETFLAWQVVAGFIGSAAFYIAMWRCLPGSVVLPRFRGDILQDVWKYAAAISANALIGVVLTQLDKVILSKMLTLKMFAYYSIASTVATAIWSIIVPFNSALFPRFVQLNEGDKKEELRQLLHRSSQLLSFVLLPIAAILIIFSREILLLWTHDIVIADNAYIIVTLLVLGTTLNGITSIPAYAASAFGWPQLVTATNMLQAFIIVPLIVGLTYWFQGTGAAFAWVVLNSTYLLFMMPRFFRRHLSEEGGSWFFCDELLPFAITLAICFVSSQMMPASSTLMFQLCWLTLTWLVAVVATGFALPHVRFYLGNWVDSAVRANNGQANR